MHGVGGRNCRARSLIVVILAVLVAAQPALATAIMLPAAPSGYPANAPVAQPAGTNRFLLYFPYSFLLRYRFLRNHDYILHPNLRFLPENINWSWINPDIKPDAPLYLHTHLG